MTGNPRLVRRLALVAFPVLLGACNGDEWLTDMKQQPSVGTWQKFSSDSAAADTIPFRGNPQGSVPVTGVAMTSWQVSYQALPFQIDSLAGIPNPTQPDARSLENGHKVYQINCAVCHGDLADGNGSLKQLNPAYGIAPSLILPMTQQRTDGYIFGMMRNGRGLMPSFNRIPEADRWDVVNYLRGLQGRYPVQTGPVGFPGQTGSALPGRSNVGPTVPVMHRKPSTDGITPKAEKAAEGAAKESKSGGHE